MARRFPASHAVLNCLEYDPDAGTPRQGLRRRRTDPDRRTPYAGTVWAIPRPESPGLHSLIADTTAVQSPTGGKTRAELNAERARRYRLRQRAKRPTGPEQLLAALTRPGSGRGVSHRGRPRSDELG